jgi:apolipoprotein N-acyltransferase
MKDTKPDLIVWPETVYPTTFGAPKSEEGAEFGTRGSSRRRW